MRAEPADHALIARAKIEWESSVDLVPELICLLDRERRVRRVNRAVEGWGLGPVRGAIGKDMHALIHPRCQDPECALARNMDTLWADFARGTAVELLVEDPHLGKVLSLQLLPVAVAAAHSEILSSGYGLLLIADITALAQAQDELKILNEQLEERVRERTRDLMLANQELKEEIARRQLAEEALRESRNELSQLSVQLMHAQESERKRIAQELHDSVGQAMSAIKYTLEHATQLQANPSLGDCARPLNRAVEQVRRLIGEVRSISTHLRPGVLDDLGVASAVCGFCREWADIYEDIDLVVRIAVTDEEVSEALATPVFRSLQEGLNNVAQHAAASRASVALFRAGDDLILEITDDGVGTTPGVKPKSATRGFGLRGLRERAEQSGGQYRFTSAPGKGSTLRLSWVVPSRSDLGEGQACAQ